MGNQLQHCSKCDKELPNSTTSHPETVKVNGEKVDVVNHNNGQYYLFMKNHICGDCFWREERRRLGEERRRQKRQERKKIVEHTRQRVSKHLKQERWLKALHEADRKDEKKQNADHNEERQAHEKHVRAQKHILEKTEKEVEKGLANVKSKCSPREYAKWRSKNEQISVRSHFAETKRVGEQRCTKV